MDWPFQYKQLENWKKYMKQLFPDIETTGSVGLWFPKEGKEKRKNSLSLRFLPRCKFVTMTQRGATWLNGALKKKISKRCFLRTISKILISTEN